MADLTLYLNPFDAQSTLTHDSGWSVNGVVSTDPDGRTCQKFGIPSDTPDFWGTSLQIEAEEKVPFHVRGLLVNLVDQNKWVFFLDDIQLQDEPAPIPIPIPPTPVPVPDPTTPQAIIANVYATQAYDLSTKQGCGMFIEEVCAQCHTKLSAQYGHIRKTGAQNNYNGHAVDAFQLLIRDNETKAGIYDCIIDSESVNARPAFNYAGDPRPDLFYYPA
jgi:hypothetical protein